MTQTKPRFCISHVFLSHFINAVVCQQDKTKALKIWFKMLLTFLQTEHCLKELGVLLKQKIRQKLGRDVESLESLSDVDIESK